MILARRSLLFDPKRANNAFLTLENVANARNLLGVEHVKDQHHGRGSSLVLDPASVGFDEINIPEQDEHLQSVSVTTRKSALYIKSEKFGRNFNCREISGTETSSLALLSLQAYGSDSSSDQIGDDLFEVPIIKPRRPRIKDGNRKKKSLKCRLNDIDLLISAIIKNKSCKSTTKMPKARKISCRSKSFQKYKNQREAGCFHAVSAGVGCITWKQNVHPQYRNTKDDTVVKDGLVTWEGIQCRCCDTVLSVSVFKFHAGFRLNRPCLRSLNLFMESVDESDENDDNCGLCGGEGELICCDSCPSTFHRACLNEQMLRSIKIDKLVMSAVPALVETWTEGFGFQRLEDDERRAMQRTANLMIFPGTVWLKKSLCRSEVSKEQQNVYRIKPGGRKRSVCSLWPQMGTRHPNEYPVVTLMW
ncbi:hypothetical protein POM88_017441 [Heracleum sosnowskyi]|uniref:Uncharacterized protein n=1 Tax=Heracleum sosnowskyi TaxID=360622 RepID=A0AAD8IQS1_9APIA|nr:hypothetical protein POM88_017441 [Heracleum sosnowskyi]